MSKVDDLDYVTDCCGESELFFVYRTVDGGLMYEPWDFCRCCLDCYEAIPRDQWKAKDDFQCNKSHY